MQITCPNCKKAYSINPEKIPSDITTAKCKACGHKMPLKPAPAVKLSPPAETCKIQCLYCNRKYSVDRSKIPADISSVKCKACGHAMSLNQANSDTTAPQEDVCAVTCLYCNKTYSIDRSKIPDNVATTKCTSCGHAISLKPKHSSILAPKKELATTGAYLKPANIEKLVQPASPVPEQSSTPLWKKLPTKMSQASTVS